jgi:hypothetical protein
MDFFRIFELPLSLLRNAQKRDKRNANKGRRKQLLFLFFAAKCTSLSSLFFTAPLACKAVRSKDGCELWPLLGLGLEFPGHPWILSIKHQTPSPGRFCITQPTPHVMARDLAPTPTGWRFPPPARARPAVARQSRGPGEWYNTAHAKPKRGQGGTFCLFCFFIDTRKPRAQVRPYRWAWAPARSPSRERPSPLRGGPFAGPAGDLNWFRLARFSLFDLMPTIAGSRITLVTGIRQSGLTPSILHYNWFCDHIC